MKHGLGVGFVLAGLLCSAPTAAATAARPDISSVLNTLNSVHAFDQVGIAPNGAYVAWSEKVISDTSGGPAASEAIFVSYRDGSDPRRISGCPQSTCDDSDFAWSADGKLLAFVTTQNGQGQIAVADAASGQVHVITNSLRGPIGTLRFAPDGSALAFLYAKGAPKQPGPLNPAARDAGVLGSVVYEQRLAITSLDGSIVRLVSPPALYVYEYDWSPNSRTFAATAAHGNGDANWWVANLYTVDVTSGAAKQIHHPALQIASPRWSGDGRSIAYIGGIMSDEGITGGDVYVVPASGGAAVNVTPELQASVMTITWNGSSSRILTTELAGGEMRVGSVNVLTKSHWVVWHDNRMITATTLGGFWPGDTGISLTSDNKYWASIQQSFTQPPEVYAGAFGSWKSITNRNAGAARLIKQTKSMTWISGPYNVQGWLVYPSAYNGGSNYPMVVVVHGGPAAANLPRYPSGPSAYDAFLASQGYFVFEPNPRGSYGQGETFTRANVKDFGYGDLQDILAGVKAAERIVPVNDKRVGVFGWSYGGYMTMWSITHTHRFRAAVSGAGLSDWLSYYGTNDIDTWMIPYFGASVYDDPQVYAKSSPITYIKNAETPTLLVAGDRDAEVPITQSYEYWHALKELGVTTSFVVYPDEGHEFYKLSDQVDVARRLVGWFDRWMP